MEECPQIINSDDPSFLEWKKREKRSSDAFLGKRKRDYFAAKHDKNCQLFEEMTLKLLSLKYSVITDKILKISKPGRRRGHSRFQFLELDFIKYDLEGIPLFGEIKHSTSPKQAMKVARRQIRQRWKGVESQWPNGSGIVICYFMSCLSQDDTPPTSFDSASQLDSYFAQPHVNGISEFCIDVDELFIQLENAGLAQHAIRSELVKSYIAMTDPVSTIDLDSAPIENSLGNAFSKTNE